MNKLSQEEELKIILTPTYIERFWSKVKRKGENDCWEWFGSITGAKRYGQVRVGVNRRGPHHVAYVIGHKKLVKDLIRHTCNNTLCCNPSHLIDGTHTENMEDMFSALRHPAQKESKERLFKMAINKLAPDEKKMLYNILLDELNSNNTN